MSGWAGLKKGDYIHALLYNPQTLLYEYQSVKISKFSSFPTHIELVFKISHLPSGKRIRKRLLVYDQESPVRCQGRWGDPIYALTKKDLGEAWKKILENYTQELEERIKNEMNYLNFMKYYVTNQNPLQS